MFLMTTTKATAGDLDLRLKEAEEFEKKGEFHLAEQAYKEVLKHTKNPGLWGALSWTQLHQGLFKEALSSAKKMRAQLQKENSLPLLASATALMGFIHHQAGRNNLAEKYYRESLKEYPRAEVYILLGTLLKHQGNIVEAKINFLRALEIDPSFVEAHYHLALWYYEHQDLHRTESHLEKALQQNPNHISSLSLFSLIQWKNGNKGMSKSKVLLENIIRNSAGNPISYLILAFTLLLMNKKFLADQYFRKGLERFPQEPRLLLAYAWFLSEILDNPLDAETYYLKTIETSPEWGVGYFYYGRHLLNQGRTREGEAKIARAKSLGFTRSISPAQG
ncbi:MAG: hypothetical protein D6748_07485 [Calditrichaeota bacterium]|nr:MAG: hypothetical protein D6748_07485 [Calditrichota bacterium]